MSVSEITEENRVANFPITVDAFLGGQVEAVQPATGHHRAGLEAVLLATSLPATTRGTIVDLGAGVGVAGFCAAARCREANVILVERDALAVECARRACARPSNAPFAGRIEIVETDIEKRGGLTPGFADAVIFNPPFRDPSAASASPEPARASAHMLGEGGLDPWFRAADGLLRPGGSVTVIFAADGIEKVFAAAKARFGALDVLPIAPRAGEPAHRILVRGIKGSRAPLRLLPPMILHGATGNGFLPEIEAILRDGSDLARVVPAWHRGNGNPS
jgi:tRNA1(Val) A37 N6-methylase TrmN6